MARRKSLPAPTGPTTIPADAFLATMFATTPLGVALIDKDLRVVRASAQFAAMYGVALAQLEGQLLADALPESAAALTALLQQVLATGEPLRDVIVKGEEGTAGRQVRAGFHPARDTNEQIVGLTLIARDVTDQVRANEAMQESEWRYRELFQHAHDIVYILDLRGTVRDINVAGERVLGYSCQELIGRQIADLVVPSFRETMAQMLSRKLEGDGVTTYELEMMAKDGRQLVLEVSSRLMLRQGKPVEIHGIARDVTERKQTEEALRSLYQQSQDAVRFRDQFLSIAAHELRTPLTALAGYADVLLRYSKGDEALPPRVHRAAETISRQALRLGALINEMLDVSRIELGQFTLQRAPTDVIALVRQSVEAAQLISVTHNVVVHAPETPLVVLGDLLRLEQVFQNLLHNAIKYSPSGELVQVRVSEHGHEVAIAVADQGIGIPAAALPHLFQRFYRVEHMLTHQIKGLGIGLYVVSEIVARHGGRVEVVSDEGEGSTFTVWLPLLET